MIPDHAAQVELRQQTEQQLQALLRETLDTVFSGACRTDLQQHGEQAIAALLQRNVEEARDQGGQGLQSLLQGVWGALENHWQQVVGLLLKVMLKALQEAFTATLKEGLSAVVSMPGEEVGQKTEAVQEKLEQKGQQLRDQLAEAIETVKQRVSEQKDQLQERLGQGIKSAVEDGVG